MSGSTVSDKIQQNGKKGVHTLTIYNYSINLMIPPPTVFSVFEDNDFPTYNMETLISSLHSCQVCFLTLTINTLSIMYDYLHTKCIFNILNKLWGRHNPVCPCRYGHIISF